MKYKNILSNKFLILIEIARAQPSAKQVDIANKLDLTPQAISKHINNLEKNNYIVKSSRELRVTKSGIQLIINSIDSLKELINDVRSNILSQAPLKAISVEKIQKGDKVNLYMEKGILKAKKADSKKQPIGKAVNPANKNEELEIKDIEGIIDLNEGKAKILLIPPIKDGGSSSVKLDVNKIDYDKSFTYGTGAVAFAKKNSIKPDYVFAESKTILSSLKRGLDCLIILDEEKKADLVEKLNQENIKFEIL